jgi:transketolase
MVIPTPVRGCPMDFKEKVKEAKIRLLRMHFESKVGHIGGNLSALDAMLFLHHAVMKQEDTFVLSKGHAAGALYVTLWSLGKLSDRDLESFHRDGTKLAGHPVAGWNEGIAFSTGSLGHGLPLAAGVALAKKIKHETGHVYCLLSDGEWEEGSNWEALIFIAHHQLSNMTMLIDANGLQGFGTTTEVASLEPLRDKLTAFDVDVMEINGHDHAELESALQTEPRKPKIIILHTIKGQGVSFMENSMAWHYLPLTEGQYQEAVREVGQS